MSRVFNYKLPSTNEERLRLTAEIERDASAVLAACGYEKTVAGKKVWLSLGFKVRDAHRQTWAGMDMPQLRRCAEAWRKSSERLRTSAPLSAATSPE